MSSSSSASAAVSDPHGITLVWYHSRYIVNVTDGVRLRVEAVDARNMSAKIFAYQLLPLKPSTGERLGCFDHVCSPPDLAEFPEDEPLPTVRPDWFRLDYIDVELRSWHELERYLADIRQDVRNLVATLNIMNTLTQGGNEVIE